MELSGDRNFRVKQARDRTRSEDYEKAKRLWFEMSDMSPNIDAPVKLPSRSIPITIR